MGSRLSFTCSICKSSSHVSDLCVQYRARAFSVVQNSRRDERQTESIRCQSHTGLIDARARPARQQRDIGDQPGTYAGGGAWREAQPAGGENRTHAQYGAGVWRHSAQSDAQVQGSEMVSAVRCFRSTEGIEALNDNVYTHNTLNNTNTQMKRRSHYKYSKRARKTEDPNNFSNSFVFVRLPFCRAKNKMLIEA